MVMMMREAVARLQMDVRRWEDDRAKAIAARMPGIAAIIDTWLADVRDLIARSGYGESAGGC